MDEVDLVLDITELCDIKLPLLCDAYFNANLQPLINAVKAKLGDEGFAALVSQGSAADAKAIVARYKK